LVATFFFEENEFFVRVSTKVPLSYNVICTECLPDLEQLLLGRFYEYTDNKVNV
jgi:hypothetical protein